MAVRRHLAEDELGPAIRALGQIEQWLGMSSCELGPLSRELAIERHRDEYVVWLFENVELPDTEYEGQTTLVPRDYDQPYTTTTFASLEEALDHAVKVHGANLNRFVNRGLARQEYLDARGPVIDRT